MERPIQTRLRYIESKDKDKILKYVSGRVGLPYRIEIKGSPIFDGKKWVLWFILPDDNSLKEMRSGNLD